jgi:hypothetical protein
LNQTQLYVCFYFLKKSIQQLRLSLSLS